ncbi:hypothetical protein [Streptomyces rubiginosohelvolus]|uniref:hypothetical protein n=1 Tax=Streptomyces rubiginosohelvolus TaxID=67362 RepID=UPI00365ADAA8
MTYETGTDEEVCGETYDHDEDIQYDGPDGVQWHCRRCDAEGWKPRGPEQQSRQTTTEQ